jgi:hypothetical protein
MTLRNLARAILFWVSGFSTFLCGFANGASPEPLALLERLDAQPYTKQIAFSRQDVLDHEIGLGAIQKVRGEWRFKHSERLSGTLVSYTWQILAGFASAQVMEDKGERRQFAVHLSGTGLRFGSAMGQSSVPQAATLRQGRPTALSGVCH